MLQQHINLNGEQIGNRSRLDIQYLGTRKHSIFKWCTFEVAAYGDDVDSQACDRLCYHSMRRPQKRLRSYLGEAFLRAAKYLCGLLAL